MLIVWVSFNYNSDSLLRFINSNIYIRWIFDKYKHDFKVHGKTQLFKSAVGLGSCIPCWGSCFKERFRLLIYIFKKEKVWV